MSGPDRPPADAAARAAAVTDFSRNLCVTAGAGCGKTSLLVERILFALLARALPLERIVAITFTTKAAAEMRARVTAALVDVQQALAGASTIDAAADAAKDEAGRTLARLRDHDAGRDLVKLRGRVAAALAAEPMMTTIHSFALALLARHPIEADLPAEAAMDLGDGFRRHAQELLPALVERALEEGPGAQPGGTAVASALARLTLGELSELARAAAWLDDDVATRSDDPLAPLRPRLVELQDELASRRAALPPAANKSNLLPHWDLLLAGLRAVIEAKPGDLPLRCPPELDALLDKDLSDAKVKGLDESERRAVRERLEEVQRILDKLRRVDEPFAADAITAARGLGRELADSFARRGFLPADGALARAATLLARHEAARRAETDAFDLLLVDEFQDTDPLQCEIVLRLCQERGAARSLPLEKVVLERGRLFLVGDPKQSIYRFRGADLEMFARARDFLLAQGGGELFLTTNFRSRPPLIDAVNRLFAPYLGPESEFEPAYVPLVAHKDADPRVAAPVELWSVVPAARDGSKIKVKARRAAEGRAIAQEIAELHTRGIGFGKIAILLRTIGVLPSYVQPLRDLAIPFVIAGGRTFVQRSEVGELASLLLAAADPQDPVACLGALRSTLFAVSDADLYAAVSDGTNRPLLYWTQLIHSQVESVARAARKLAALHAIVDTFPAADAVERIVEASLLLPLSAAARDGEQRIANLRKLAAQAVARSEETRLPLAAALRDLLATHEQVEAESERSLADEEIEAVRILTIHKAKGLEYDVVFIGDLGRQSDRNERGDVELRVLASGGGARVALAIPPLDVWNAAEVARGERERRHQQAEGKRLLYVACTRARDRLYLVHSAKPGASAPWLEPLGALGFAGDGHAPADGLLPSGVRHRQIDEPPRRREPVVASPAPLDELAAAARRFAKAAAAARAAMPRFERPSSAGAEPETAARDGSGANHDAELARAVGIAAHAALAASGPATAPSDEQIDAAAARAAAESRLDAAAIAKTTRELLRAAPARGLQRLLEGVRVRAIELPLTLHRDGRSWRGSADLVFFDGDELVVGDWKSDRVAGPSDDAGLAERYRPQLSIYRDALQSALRLADPPRMELLLLRSGRRVPL